MYQKIGVTPQEMLTMREDGLSNHDIAKALDISYATVLKYIGKQPGRMESLEAFRDQPKKERKKEERKEVETVVPKYNPKPVEETYEFGTMKVVLSNSLREAYVYDAEDKAVSIPYQSMPDLVQFLVWAMRERMGATADSETEQV